ncbi:hypothetical protein HMPREF9371_0402 [Neisseria shayeganii 871]|uniref:Uncharacterized protein n=1 Tax=Neisseria shayeganii 871 TaxID=1032488 RepID=G4CFL3_9NEIS|nr:hypothetical protein HMPREF9371_0402 [Neisseria shayeganii 871]
MIWEMIEKGCGQGYLKRLRHNIFQVARGVLPLGSDKRVIS